MGVSVAQVRVRFVHVLLGPCKLPGEGKGRFNERTPDWEELRKIWIIQQPDFDNDGFFDAWIGPGSLATQNGCHEAEADPFQAGERTRE
jgi:hypothetical protein